MRRLSIGLRLTLSYFIVFAAAQLLFGFGMWFILRHSLFEISDNELANQMDDLRHFLQAQKKDASIAKLQEEVTESYVLEHSGDYLQIYAPPSDWIYRAPFMQKASFTPTADRFLQAVHANRRVGGKPFRFVSQSIVVSGRRFDVQTGVPIDDETQTLALFRSYLLLFAPVILLAASMVGYWVSTRALSPVDALTRAARTIGGSDLSRRLEPLHTGDELQRLSDTLNEMLSRIEAAFSRITQFTANASHELRTPVSLIRTEAEIALRKSRTPEEYREALLHIQGEAETTTLMIEKLLTIARADTGREVLEMCSVDLRGAGSRAADMWRTVASSRSLGFLVSVTETELNVMGDKTALQQLLNILLDNAVKYTPPPGQISLLLDERGDQAVIRVADTGIGIASEDQGKIFERFYRADKARSRDFGGAGLGLAIALWIVQQHNGSIAVESTPGKGSAFEVHLPVWHEARSASGRQVQDQNYHPTALRRK